MEQVNISNKFSFSIAGIGVSIKLRNKHKRLVFRASDPLLRFESLKVPCLELNIEPRLSKDIPKFLSKRLIFDNQVTWKFSELGDGSLLWQDGAGRVNSVARIASINKKFTTGSIFQRIKNRDSSTEIFNPISYPLDQLIFIHLLSQKHGGLFHASGVDCDDKGLLFLGKSGQGKSTMAELWYKHTESIILNDDRVAVRRGKNGFWIYGTPWHGSGRFACPHKVRLKKIFFLHHSKENFCSALKPVEAATKLFTASFPPMWDKKGLSDLLSLCLSMAGTIPAYDLYFHPDQDIIRLIREDL